MTSLVETHLVLSTELMMLSLNQQPRGPIWRTFPAPPGSLWHQGLPYAPAPAYLELSFFQSPMADYTSAPGMHL